jgi:superfamily II DNA or RNA helicase
MNSFHDDLTESIKTGFLDQHNPCKEEYLPQLLVNDSSRGKKVLTTILKELSECEEFWFSVAFVTKGGVATIINTLKELEERNIKGKILASQYQCFTEPEALKTLLLFKNVELRMAEHGDFHGKGYLFKRKNGYNLIIGSSNLTDKALGVNKEFNLKISATENSTIVTNTITEFTSEFEQATPVDKDFITRYEAIYKVAQQYRAIIVQSFTIQPNSMQVEALANLKLLREQNKTRALLISATATGKTYLSAFDVKNIKAQRCLFIVHRANIAAKAMESFGKIFGKTKTLGMYSGERKDISPDFLFSTIQTLSKDNHLSLFNKDHFDYIIIDETHRSGAASYQKVINYFQPKFLLGMTATPERTDDFDIFKLFNYDIAYEIRLQRALAEDMLSPFHYYGITDVIVEERTLKQEIPFNLLVSEERVNKIIEKATFYGSDNGCIRGLIFCSSVEESKELSNLFNKRGYKTVSLSGKDNEAKRETAITQLESNNQQEKLDYIFTVDIFNEGIDIPKVNQVILLRPTQSAIVFVQQLGRGLRKADNKSYLTVLDFIGNYSNNYLVPIALFGDTSFKKDSLRKLVRSGSSLIAGASTVNFDPIAKERIFKSIDSANLSFKKDLVQDYKRLKFEIGKIPTMVDFMEHGSRDPYLFVECSKSYYNFVAELEDSLKNRLSVLETKLVELFSKHVANGKRIEEVIILKELLTNKAISITAFKEKMLTKYNVPVSDATIHSCISNINFEFINSPEEIVSLKDDVIQFHGFSAFLKNEYFKDVIKDTLDYAQMTYDDHFKKGKYVDGFILYQKYSRKDVCRILNWNKNEDSTIYGYKIKHNTCAIFVNYHKEENISNTTKYEDRFINNYEFEWMSRTGAKPDGIEMKKIEHYKKDGLRLSLFIKKSNDEGNDFYYMGDMTPIKFELATMANNKAITRVTFTMNDPVESTIYDYIVNL